MHVRENTEKLIFISFKKYKFSYNIPNFGAVIKFNRHYKQKITLLCTYCF